MAAIPRTRSRPQVSSLAVVAALTAVSAAAFVGVAVARWMDFDTDTYDLAIFDQVIWSTARGAWFQTSFLEYQNYLGQHVSPVLLLFVPFYWLGAGPLFLTVVQALVAAVAAVPLFLAARRWHLPHAVALALPIAYLLNPYLHRALAFDFHPETMVALPAFLSLWALSAKRPWYAVLAAAGTLLLKEDAVCVAIPLAVVIFAAGYRVPAAALALVALAWGAVALTIVMPHFRAGMPSDLLIRYDYLTPAATEREVLAYVATHPWVLARHVLTREALWTMGLLLLVTAPLVALRPWWLLAMLPGLAVAVLSAHGPQRHLELHYGVEAITVAIVLLTVVARSLPVAPRPGAVAAAIVVPTALGMIALSPLLRPTSDIDPTSARHREAIVTTLALIPPGDTVSAQTGLGAHLSQRPVLDEFPGRKLDVEWVVIDSHGPISPTALSWGFWDALDQVRAHYDLVYSDDGVELYMKPGTVAN